MVKISKDELRTLVSIFVDISTILQGIDKGDLVPEFSRISELVQKKGMSRNQQIKVMVEFLRREVEKLED